MEHLLQFGLSNVAAAAVLAVLAAVATRVWRNPHFAYALWFVVLLRLVAPPLLPIALPVPAWLAANSPESLPAVSESQKVLKPPVEIVEPIPRSIGESARGAALAPDRTRLATPPAAPLVGHDSELVDRAHVPQNRSDPEGTPPRGPSGLSQNVAQGVSPTLSQTVPPSSRFRWPSIATIVATVWLSGTLCYLLLTAIRVQRFGRVLRRARRDVPAGIAAEAAEVAAAVRLRRVPRLALTEAALPPMVWPGWRPIVLLPKTLFASLGSGERRLLLCHEFLHLRRRDHLVRWFEVGVVGLYWWNPIAWWAVAQLQGAEEDCCDAAVLCAHPHESARYGETLVSVAQFLSVGTLRTPSLSVGVARNGHIKRRLTMILHGPRWPELSKTRLAAFSLLGAALVAVTWTAAKAQTAPAAPAATGTSPSASTNIAETRLVDGLAKPQPERDGWKIDEILVEGNVRVPTADILKKLNIQAGRKAPQSQIEAGCNAVMKTRQFYSAIPTFRRTGNKTTLTLRVLEKPLVRNVSYFGAQMETQFETKQLAAVTGLKVGDPYFIVDNREAARRLEKFYHKHGYPEATVELLQGDKPDDRDVVFAIDESGVPKIVWRYFVGNESVSSERLAKELKSSPTDAGKFDRMNLAEDAAALRKYYASVGFRNTIVTPVVLHSKDRKWIYVQYTVQEGLPYQPVMGINADTKSADGSPASSRLVPTVPVPEKRDVRLSKIEEMQPASGDDELRKLQKERFNAALRELKLYEYQYEAGTTRIGEVCKATRSLFDTWSALAQRPDEQLHALDWYVGYTNRLWNIASSKLVAGGVTAFSPVDEAEARGAHFEAEIEAMKLRQRLASKTPGDKPGKAEGDAGNPARTTHPAVRLNTVWQREFARLPRLLKVGPLWFRDDQSERVKFLVKQYSVAQSTLKSLWFSAQRPRPTANDLLTAARQLRVTHDELGRPLNAVTFYEQYVELMKTFESLANRSPSETYPQLPPGYQVEAFREERLAAEQKLIEVKRAAHDDVVGAPATKQGAAEGTTKLGKPDLSVDKPVRASNKAVHKEAPFPSPALLTQTPLAPEAGDDERHKLLKERYNAALRMLQATYARHGIHPTTTLIIVVAAARRMLAADLALAGDGVAVREQYLEFTKYLEREAEAWNAARQIGTDELEAAHEARLDAELELLEAKTGKAAPAKSDPAKPDSSKSDPAKSDPFSFYVGPTR